MKHRNPTTTLLLSLFVPFYSIYWLYTTGKSLEERGIQMPPIYMVFMPGIIMAILMFASLPSLTRATETNNTPAMGVIGLLFAVAYIVAIVVPAIYYYKFSKGASQFTQNQLTTGILFILFVIFAPVAIYMIQDKLNDLPQGSAAPPTPPIA